MRALFGRELRRLAPLGLGLGLGLPAAHAVFRALRHRAPFVQGLEELTRTSSAVLIAAAIVGAATVAPDTSSGGVAFLSRLPVSRLRAHVAKVAAGLVWALGAVVAITLLEGGGRLHVETLAIVPLVFGAACLASVAVHTVVPALAVAPVVAAACFLIGFGGSLLCGIELSGLAGGVLGVALGAACLVASAVAYTRGERYRESRRPAVLGLGAALVLCLGVLGAAEAAHAWSLRRNLASLAVVDAQQRGDWLAVTAAGEHWYGADRRVLFWRRSSGEAWTAPLADAVEVALAPDHRRALISRAGRPGLALVDLDARRVTELSGFEPRLGFDIRRAVWREDGPLLVERCGDAALFALDPASGRAYALALPRRLRQVAAVEAAGAALVVTDEGVERVTGLDRLPPPPPGRSEEFGALSLQVTRSSLEAAGCRVEPVCRFAAAREHVPWVLTSAPSGRYLVLATHPREGQGHHELLDVRTGRRLTLGRIEPAATRDAQLAELRARFTPDEGRVVLQHPASGWAACFDLPGGQVVGELRGDHARVDTYWSDLRISPDGGVVVLCSGATWDLRADRVEARREVVPGAWLDAERVLALHRPVSVGRWPAELGELRPLGAALVRGGGALVLDEEVGR